MSQPKKPIAKSHYRGLRVTVTQNPGHGASLVSVAVKPPRGAWDEWSLLFPAIKVETMKVDDYTGVLKVVIATVEALLEADEKYR